MERESTEKLMESLKKSMQRVSDAKNTIEMNRQIESLLMELTTSNYASLFIFDAENQTLYTKDKEPSVFPMVAPEGCLGKVFLTKSSAIYNHLASDKDYVPKYDNHLKYKLKSQMLMPLIEKEQLVGIVRVSRSIKGVSKYYTNDDLEALGVAHSYLIKMTRTLTSKTHLNESKNYTEAIENNLHKNLKKEPHIDDKNMLLFVANTVHDIRTPANSLYGFLELLEEQVEDKRLKEFVVNAKESASFINTLTDSILAKTKNRYEGSISKPMVVNTVKFFSDTVNTFTAKMSEKQIDYFIYIFPNLPKEIKIDTLKLKRVLINLIGNAYKFTPKEHRIDVVIDYNTQSKQMMIFVKDTGIGIEAEDQKKLFKAFSQATEETSMEYGGTGLGLAISAEYVSDLGGELKLHSRVGEGSEFYFDVTLDIVNEQLSYEKLHDLDKKIVILTDDLACKDAKYIRNYLIKLGMPSEKIIIADKIKKETTHLICFQHKMTKEVLALAASKKVKLLLIEERLFSLLKKKEANQFKIVSKNTYYGDALYSLVFSGKKTQVLIVDDNKINIKLLLSMLSTEYVEITTCSDGESTLNILKDAARQKNSFDVVYLDKHMPGVSGTKLLDSFRKYERENKLNPIFAVSISGDPEMSKVEKSLYNAFVNKPFNKQEVREVIKLLKK